MLEPGFGRAAKHVSRCHHANIKRRVKNMHSQSRTCTTGRMILQKRQGSSSDEQSDEAAAKSSKSLIDFRQLLSMYLYILCMNVYAQHYISVCICFTFNVNILTQTHTQMSAKIFFLDWSDRRSEVLESDLPKHTNTHTHTHTHAQCQLT